MINNTEQNKSTIGERIRILRKEKRISQEALGIKVGVSQQMITQIEKGRKTPSEELIKKIAEYFEVSEAWLVYGGMVLVHRDRKIQEKIDKLYPRKNDHFFDQKFQEIVEAYFPDIEIDPPPVRKPQKEDEIIGYYIQLNDEGQKKATEYVKDLTKIDAYRKPDDECPF